MQPTTANVINLADLYKEHFSRNPYHVNTSGQVETVQEVLYSGLKRNARPKGTIHVNRFGIDYNKQGAYGQDIWFPIKLSSNINISENSKAPIFEHISVDIDACTTSVQLIKSIVRTPVIERKGSVIEVCDIENPRFTIRGFLIDKNRQVPEQDILNLTKMFETTSPILLHGGYVDLFLAKSDRVVISDLEFPEVQGRNHWIRPFTLQCEADFIEDLINIPS